MGEFVVDVDTAAVHVVRRRLIRLRAFTVGVDLVSAALILVCAVAMARSGGGPSAFLLFFAVSAFGYIGVQDWRRLSRLRAGWKDAGIPAVAMRLSDSGIHMAVDVAPDAVFVPWGVVQAMRLIRRKDGRTSLAVELTPGVHAATAGVVGFDQHEIRRLLRNRVYRRTGLRLGTWVAERPLDDIDRAVDRFSAGRVPLLS